MQSRATVSLMRTARVAVLLSIALVMHALAAPCSYLYGNPPAEPLEHMTLEMMNPPR